MDNKPIFDNEWYLSQDCPITIICENDRCRIVFSRDYPDRLFLILYPPQAPNIVQELPKIEIIVKELYVGNTDSFRIPYEVKDTSLGKPIDRVQFYEEIIKNHMEE